MSDLALPPDRSSSPEVDKGEMEDRMFKEARDEVIVVGKTKEARDEVIVLGKTKEARDEGIGSKSDWVAAAMDKKVLKKYDVEVSTKDGVHKVEIPDMILDNSTPLWEDFVVEKFLELVPHVAKVHMVLNKIWRYGDPSVKVEVFEVNATTMRFKVSSSKAREKILRRGMWNIVGVPMIVSKWSPTVEDEKQEEETIPMWVHLEKVPLHMYSWEGLSFITSHVGHPVKLHPETIACSNFDEAKVFVKVDVTKTLPKEITFSKNNKEFTVKYYYPWLPARCSYCDKWGHGEVVCAKKIKEMKNKNGSSVKEKSSIKKRTPEVISNKSNIQELCGEAAMANGEVIKEATINLEMRLADSQEGGNEWALVSPAKSGRVYSPPVEQSENILISASKYSVLNVEEDKEEGEIVVGEEELEVEHDQIEVYATDLLEDGIIDQQEREKVKSGMKKGRGRGPKAKTQAVNAVKSIRSSCRNN